MLTILTLEFLNSRISSKEHIKKSGNYVSGSEINDKLKEEQLSKEKNERIENFIILLPLLITLVGYIIMCILDKIFG